MSIIDSIASLLRLLVEKDADDDRLGKVSFLVCLLVGALSMAIIAKTVESYLDSVRVSESSCRSVCAPRSVSVFTGRECRCSTAEE